MMLERTECNGVVNGTMRCDYVHTYNYVYRVARGYRNVRVVCELRAGFQYPSDRLAKRARRDVLTGAVQLFKPWLCAYDRRRV